MYKFFLFEQFCALKCQGAEPTDRVTLHITFMDFDVYAGEDSANCSDSYASLIIQECIF